jgi:hypothetical protein
MVQVVVQDAFETVPAKQVQFSTHVLLETKRRHHSAFAVSNLSASIKLFDLLKRTLGMPVF